MTERKPKVQQWVRLTVVHTRRPHHLILLCCHRWRLAVMSQACSELHIPYHSVHTWATMRPSRLPAVCSVFILVVVLWNALQWKLATKMPSTHMHTHTQSFCSSNFHIHHLSKKLWRPMNHHIILGILSGSMMHLYLMFLACSFENH